MLASGRSAGLAVVLAISSTAAFLAPGPPLPAGVPVFHYIFPNGGVFPGGGPAPIFWNVTHGPDTHLFLTIRYSIDSGATYPYLITAAYFPTGPAMWWWSVPFLNVTAMRLRLCAAAADGSRGCAAGASDSAVTSTPPYLSLLSPAGGAEGVPLDEPVVIGVSTGIDPATVSYGIAPPTGVVPSWSPDMRSLTLSPDPGWDPCTAHAASFTANDSGGSPVGPYDLAFTTVCAPAVFTASPANGATGVPVAAPVTVRFSTPMDPPNVTWTVSGGISMQGAWSEGGARLTLTHATPFAGCAAYTVQIAGRDLDGAPLQTGPVPNPWSFTTVCSPPYIASTVPGDGAADVPVSTDIVVTFSEAMNRSSVAWTIVPAMPLAVVWNGTSTAATAFPIGTRQTSVKDVTLAIDPYPGGDIDEWLCRQRPPNEIAFDVPPGTSTLVVRLTSNASDADLGLWRDENGNDTCDFGVDTFLARSATAASSESIALSSPSAGRYLAQVGPFTALPGSAFDLDVILRSRVSLLECTAYTFTVAPGRDTEDADLVPGPAPNPFSFTTACAVGIPRGLGVLAIPPDVVHLTWTLVAGADRYRVYESPDRFAPFPWTVLGETTSASFDATHLADGMTHHYIVRAVSGTQEGGNSTMGVKADLSFGFNAGATNIAWFSLPYASPYRRASDIAGELGPGKVDLIGRWDPLWQNSTVYYFARGGWKGTDFPINPGDGLYLGTTSAFRWAVAGTDRAVVLSLERDAAPARNVAWVSLPFTSSYRRASDIVLGIEGSLDRFANTHIVEVGKWDAGAQTAIVYQWAGGWRGTDFEIFAGDGVYVRVVTSFDWRPELLVPEVP